MKIITLNQETYEPFERGVVYLYQNCFAEPPWHEIFEYDEINADFRRILTLADNIFLAIVDEQGQIVGVTVYFPLIFKNEVAKIINSEYNNAIYCAELFVEQKHRCRGVGSVLMKAAHEKAKKLGYKNIVLRTSQIHQPLIDFYKKRGFQEIAFMQCRSIKLINGHMEEIPDPRTIFVCSLIANSK